MIRCHVHDPERMEDELGHRNTYPGDSDLPSFIAARVSSGVFAFSWAQASVVLDKAPMEADARLVDPEGYRPTGTMQ